MKAVGYKKSLPVDAAEALLDFEAPKPEPKGRDIRVAVKAISANPVDYKVRKRAAPPEGETKILGYDAAGVVDAVGPDVTLFKAGDEVFYAGSIQRQGTNSEFHLVDERIVGRKPKALSFAQAAALPLTSITAWELLFDRLGAVPGKSVDPRTLLITGGAGGVGSIQRQGTNSEFHLVDERIVGRKPKALSFAQAAALPLTSITAWELLFDRLGAVPEAKALPLTSLSAEWKMMHDQYHVRQKATLLITGGAGGVGSILIQLARRLTGLTVVATATRPESQQWCLDLGAHAVIDHNKPMKEQIEKLKLPPVALVASLTFTEQHYKTIADLMAPQGKFGLIDDPVEFNVSVFKGKAISVHWESMFTRSSFQTADMIGQHRLLNDVADLIDKGVLRTTLDQAFGTINAANLKRAHALLESGKSRGKIVLEGW